MRIPAFFIIGPFVIALGAGMASASATETVCKGLATDACTGNAGCSWVKPHKLKNGKEMAGFCRKKATRQSVSPKAPAKAS